MPYQRHRLSSELTTAFAGIRSRLKVREEFPAEALALAGQRASQPSHSNRDHADRRDIPLLSIDPEGSRDLDQALHLARSGSGFTFHYAIADVAHWVHSGDAIDAEARLRGSTVYCPDRRFPLHPSELSEGAASLLEGQDGPAVLWSIELDQHGEIADVHVERAIVRNQRALSYAAVQKALDAGTTDDQFRLIQEIGELRLQREIDRGGVSLELPDQVVDRVGDHYELRYDEPLTVERWNAQLSLCCGIAAARLMLDARCGILRTLPSADPVTLDRLRLHSAALGVDWPADMSYPQWVRTLDPATPSGAALMAQAAKTLRGADYLAFDGDVPSDHQHHAIASDYAHVTAPLRRLADRFANECVLAAADGSRPPTWVLDSLPALPGIMASAARLSSQVDHAVVDLAEAAALAHLVGTTFDAVVTASNKGFSTIQLTDPAVIGSVPGDLTIGSTVRARLEVADIAGPTVRFTVATE